MAALLEPYSCWPSGFTTDDWVWSADDRSPEVMLSSDHQAAYFHTDPVRDSTGTAGVRGTKGFLDGEHYWEVRFLEPAIGSSVMIGVGSKNAVLHTEDQYVNLIGRDKHSWGLSYKGQIWHCGQPHAYCSPFYDAATVIGVHLNFYTGTLTFFCNGQNLGVAFQGLNRSGEKLYPIISSTAMSTELEIGWRVSRYLSLQEKCCQTIAQSVKRKTDIEKLPLPPALKRHLVSFK